jgi:asparagine synthase (glutamine-hydrolysing)
MCGIAGWVDFESNLAVEGDTVQRMADTMGSRGPDASGICLYAHAVLAHRRLIVVDPQGGGQPMTRCYGDRTYTIIYNGQLFNATELRDELKARGYSFQSYSDTEVLLQAFVEWGEDSYHKLNGMYAFAVWSEHDERLFLCRDRLGIKPLFYCKAGHGLLFASEQKGLLAHPMVSAELDREGIAEVFGLGPAHTPGHGVFRGIYSLLPGACLQFDRDGLRLRKYWRFVSKPHSDDLETTAATVRSIIEDSLSRQLVSDVPVCALLSGGMDSSTLTVLAAREFTKRGLGQLHTYSVDFEGNDQHFQANDFQPNADGPWIKRMSEHAGTCHHYVTIDTASLAESLDSAVLARDVPGMADIDSSLLLFCREIKKDATVILSGECADEVFAGYPWFHRSDMLEADTFPWSRSVQMRASLLAPELREEVDIEGYVERRYRETLDEVPRLPGERGLDARVREVSYLTITWFMQTLLDRKDRMAMASGLEARVPFCDHRLVEYVWNVPWEMKRHGGMAKGILRKALEGLLPSEVLMRQKSPYPKTHNPRFYTLCRDRLLEILADPGSPLRSLVNANYIGDVAQSGGHAFRQPWFGQLMTDAQLFAYLIQVDTWMRRYRVSLC